MTEVGAPDTFGKYHMTIATGPPASAMTSITVALTPLLSLMTVVVLPAVRPVMFVLFQANRPVRRFPVPAAVQVTVNDV